MEVRALEFRAVERPGLEQSRDGLRGAVRIAAAVAENRAISVRSGAPHWLRTGWALEGSSQALSESPFAVVTAYLTCTWLAALQSTLLFLQLWP